MINVNASESEILACEFRRWYNNFDKLSIKSRVIECDEQFIQYLDQDSIIIPNRSQSLNLRSDDDNDDNDSSCGNTLDLYELSQQLEEGIKEIGAPVFVKFNWSAPLDASWINGGSLKCYKPEDIYLLLKASDRIAFDLDHTFDLCQDRIITRPKNVSLIIRKWENINPGMEFRLFVFHKKLAKVCQRDCSTYYPYLAQEKSNILSLLQTFYNQEIFNKFTLSNFTLDTYITDSKRIRIIDFNPAGEPTSALLFEWLELSLFFIHDDANQDIEFRIIEKESDCLTSTKGLSRAPIDVSQAPDFYNFMKICREQNRNDSSDG